MIRSLKQAFSSLILASFLFQSLLQSYAFAMDRGLNEEPETYHERHLKKAGYWNLHKEIKADKSDFLKKNTSIQGHKGVAYLAHLGQQIETLLSVPFASRLQKQCDDLQRLSEWVYAMTTHACGFSGFDRKATDEEAKRMKRALTFSLIASKLQPSFILRVIHDSFDPYYLGNAERQNFFKGLLCQFDVISEIWNNHLNGWPAAYYRHVTLPKFHETIQKRILSHKQQLEEYRNEYQELLDTQQKARAWEEGEEWSDEEEEEKNAATESSTPRRNPHNPFENSNVRVSKSIVKQMRAMFPTDEERELQQKIEEHQETLLRGESFHEYNKEFEAFRGAFLDCFDFEELDALLDPYVKTVLDTVGKHGTGTMHVSLFAPYFYPKKDDRQELIRIINDESYYDSDTDDEEENDQDNLETLEADSNSSSIQGSDELLHHWKRNGIYGQFHKYFKSIYVQEMKRKRLATLASFGYQFIEGTLEEIESLRGQFLTRKREYDIIKHQPRPKKVITLTAAQMQSSALALNADEVIINSGTSHSTYSQSVSQSNFFGKQAYGQTSYQEERAPSQINTRMIILGRDTHLTLAGSTQLPPDIKILGGSYSIREEAPLRNWTTSWSKSSQTIPTPVVCALSMGAAVLTQGLSAGLTGVAMGAVSGTAVQATLTGNDPFKAVTSERFLKNLSIQLATAGLTNQLSQSLGININPGSQSFADHLKGAALRQAVNTSVNVALGNQNIHQALTSAIKNIGIDSVGGFMANQIGQAYGNEQINAFVHKAAHGVLGGVAGFASKGNQQAIISGAVGAIAAETVFELMVSKETIEQRALEIAKEEISKGNRNSDDIQQKVLESFQQQRDIAKIAGMMSSATLGKDADISFQTASNAVDNNNAIVLALRAAPAINWAIRNPDKVIKGVHQAVNLFNIFERAGKEAQNTNIKKGGNSNPSQGDPGEPEKNPRNNKNEQEKSIKSLEKQIEIHQKKIRDFQENPTVRPGMEDQPIEVIKKQQQERIKHLEKEIDKFRNNIKKIKKNME